MKNTRTLRTRTTSTWPKVLTLAALSCALLTPAMARDTRGPHGQHGKHHVTLRQHHDRHGHQYYDRHHYRSHRSARHHRDFVVPVRLTHTALATYRNYHHGRVYYRPHHHYHTVYSFPVHTNAGWAYQPHYYCNGDLYRGRGPHHDHHVRFSIHY